MSLIRFTDEIRLLWMAAGLQGMPDVECLGYVAVLDVQGRDPITIEPPTTEANTLACWRVVCGAGGSSRHASAETAARGAILALVAARMNRALAAQHREAEGGDT